MNPTAIDPLTLPSLPMAELSKLPACAGIYFTMVGDRILSIERTTNLQQEMGHHRYPKPDSKMRIAWFECNELELLPDIEAALITRLKPSVKSLAQWYYQKTAGYE
ncbi:MAG TPA: hypothetical protein VK211_21050 [Kamptonema sp.]|nr:hypothetical protein [Kamptonema sp.]